MDLQHTQFTSTLLSRNTETDGFDTQAGQTWIYPTNYQERLYQYNIVQEALHKNTLVSLPTGLGKTFIAAVVMYNFYRWYPTGKVVFIAPTKPLVKQQIDACYDITAIPKEITAELTGTKIQTSRIDVWNEKRVFFVTPQVLQNDLDNVPGLATKIKCVVFDEAHKAKGNHSYCEVVRKMIPHNRYFRVLALSATPGSTVNDVIEVTNNLLISHLELRTDESPDVTPYVFQRSLETIVVPLEGKLRCVKDKYMQILEQYTRILVTHKVIQGNCGNITKGRIFMTMKDFQEKNKYTKMSAYGEIMRSLNICVTLYHGYELLLRNGLRSFLNFFEEHSEKPLLRGSATLQEIVRDVAEYLGPKPNVNVLPDGTTPTISENTRFGHPKFYKLRDLLLKHFMMVDDEGSRAIVFSEYRESVIEVHALLTQHKPTIRPRIFLGQGAITQREQLNTVKAFREGLCNTLISTCIGEEGLDIGEVDLIVCFDITNKSPVRMVQRMGRTGRKRQGRVVVLVSEGKEQQILKECLINKNNLSNNILTSRDLNKNMYARNPRMIPANVAPVCQKMHITVPKVKIKQKTGNLKDLLNNMARQSESPTLSQQLQDVPIDVVYTERIPPSENYWNKANPFDASPSTSSIDFSKRLEKLRVLQPIDKIGHSANTEILVSLLQFADSKRYNIPVTQLPKIVRQLPPSSPKKKGKSAKCGTLDNFVQSDIRTMFTKHKSFDVATEVIEIEETLQSQPINKPTTFENELLNELHQEIATYLSISYATSSSCLLCDNVFPCFRIKDASDDLKLREWTQPDLEILDTIDDDNLRLFFESLSPQSADFRIEMNVDDLEAMNMEFEQSNNDIETKLFLSTPPKSIEKVFDKCDSSIVDDDMSDVVVDVTAPNRLGSEPKTFTRLVQRYVNTLNFFDLNVVGDIFERVEISSPVLSASLHSGEFSPILGSYDRVRFFNNKVGKNLFDKNDDTFKQSRSAEAVVESKASSVRKVNSKTNTENRIANNPVEFPAINEFVASDIDCLITSNSKCFDDKFDVKNSDKAKPNLSNLRKQPYSNFYNFKSKETNLQESHCKEKRCLPENLDVALDSKNPKKDESKHIQELMSNINDFCDFSVFELDVDKVDDLLNKGRSAGNLHERNATDSTQKTERSNQKIVSVNISYNSDDLFGDSFDSPTKKQENRLSMNNCCDLSAFGLTAKATDAKRNTINKLNIDDICDMSIFGMNGIENVVKKTDTFYKNKIDNRTLGIDDVCDLSSIFELDKVNRTIETKRRDDSPAFQLEKNDNNRRDIKKHEETKSKVLDIDDICDTSIFGFDKKNKSNVIPIITDVFESFNLSNETCKSSTKKSPIAKSATNTCNINSIVGKYVPVIIEDCIDLTCLDSPTKSNDKDISVTQIVSLMGSDETSQLNVRMNESNVIENCNKSQASTSKLPLLSTLEDDNSFTNENFNFKNKRSKLTLTLKTTPNKQKSKPIATKTTPSKNVSIKKPTQNNRKIAFNASSYNSPNSDDDFDLSMKNNGWIKTKNRNEAKPKPATNTIKKKIFEDEPTGSSQDFDSSPMKNFNRSTKITSESNSKKKIKKKTTLCDFIETEAQLSPDENAVDDTSSEGGSSQDVFESSFINDDTIDVGNTSMHVRYLKSVRSPLLNKGTFMIRNPASRRNIDVFSQVDSYTENTYVNDSFCVNTEEVDLTQTDVEMSELEVAEMILRQRKRKKKKSQDGGQCKYRRITISSDSE